MRPSVGEALGFTYDKAVEGFLRRRCKKGLATNSPQGLKKTASEIRRLRQRIASLRGFGPVRYPIRRSEPAGFLGYGKRTSRHRLRLLVCVVIFEASRIVLLETFS